MEAGWRARGVPGRREWPQVPCRAACPAGEPPAPATRCCVRTGRGCPWPGALPWSPDGRPSLQPSVCGFRFIRVGFKAGSCVPWRRSRTRPCPRRGSRARRLPRPRQSPPGFSSNFSDRLCNFLRDDQPGGWAWGPGRRAGRLGWGAAGSVDGVAVLL